MGLGRNLNPRTLFYRWDGEPPGPAPACLSPFVVQRFPSVDETFHPPARQSPTARGSREIYVNYLMSH